MKIAVRKALLTTRQVILYLVDAHNFMYQIFDGSKHYEKAIDDYFAWREFDKQRFRNVLNRLKKEKIIEIFHKNNEEMVKLTDKGKNLVPHYLTEEVKSIHQSAPWDGKWRLVIFDIPNDKRKTRDAFRRKLIEFGFYLLQESVFVFPYDCAEEIRYLRELFNIKSFVKYIVADTIEAEIDLVSEFIDRGILSENLSQPNPLERKPLES